MSGGERPCWARVSFFRKVIETGIVMAVTKGIAVCLLLVALGILAGLVAASLVAAFATAIGQALLRIELSWRVSREQ